MCVHNICITFDSFDGLTLMFIFRVFSDFDLIAHVAKPMPPDGPWKSQQIRPIDVFSHKLIMS